MKRDRTIKQRIFHTNSLMVLWALLVLLCVGGGMILIFKSQFLNWYRDNSKISDQYIEVYQKLCDLQIEDKDWEQVAQSVAENDFRLIVQNTSGKTIYTNAKHNEIEGAEPIYKAERTGDEIESYMVVNMTVFAMKQTIGGQEYELYFVNCPNDDTLYGIDKGMFETFIFAFLVVGGLVIVIVLLLCQLMTKRLIGKIMDPLNQLNDAANRIMEGNLERKIAYQGEDEFQNVCETFDLMQYHLKEEMEQNRAYEKARTEMVSGISHDLRTPLTSIKGYIKGMLDGIANTEEKRQEYLAVAYKKSCDMERLLEKLFYFSKLETGNMPFYLTKINMKNYLEQYVQEKQAELKTRDISVTGSLDGIDGVFCNVDASQMQRVFDNLIENSCKYAAPEGALEIAVKAERQENVLHILVSDNGKGMEEEKIQHVFEQFYRGDEARNAACDGNGLGLYVCRYIVEKHGGTMTASGKHGFTVELILPIVTEKDKQEEE